MNTNKNLISVLLFFGSLLLGCSSIAQEPSPKQALSAKVFKEKYLSQCKKVKEIPPLLKSKFCECMANKYVKAGYADQRTLEIVSQVYEKRLPKKMKQDENLTFNFDAEASEECLAEIKTKK